MFGKPLFYLDSLKVWSRSGLICYGAGTCNRSAARGNAQGEMFWDDCVVRL